MCLETLVRYALLLYDAPGVDGDATVDAKGTYDEWLAYFHETKDAGVFVAAEGLGAVDTATTVRRSAGELLLTDGPFAETKEHLLGFYLIEATNLDAAIEWASRMPILRAGSVEIRPLRPVLPDVGRTWHRAAE
jgi:hypothetical protein